MAYDTTGNVLQNVAGMAPGRSIYTFDFDGSVDDIDDIEAAGYFNNKDDMLNLQKGDMIFAKRWSAVPFAAASLVQHVLAFVVTNVIANDAAASAGNVNIAQALTASSTLSSLL